MNRPQTGGICFSGAVLLILSGCAAQQRITSRHVQFSSAPTGVIKLMTFNIRVGLAWWDGFNCWNRRKQIVVDTLVDNATDIIGLQEALDYQVEQIQQALPQYARYAVGRDNGKQKGEACAIFYREDRFELHDCGTFWFSKTPTKPGSKHWGNIWPRICSWAHLVDKADGTGFYVYNVHLAAWSQNARSKSVRLLADRIVARKTQDPFIVMGDFNMKLSNPAMKYLQNIDNATPLPRMADTWLSVNHGKASIGTAHGFSGRTSGPKLDHIAVSEHAQALDAKIDRYELNGRYPSDHFPVTATIRVLMAPAISAKQPEPEPTESLSSLPDT